MKNKFLKVIKGQNIQVFYSEIFGEIYKKCLHGNVPFCNWHGIFYVSQQCPTLRGSKRMITLKLKLITFMENQHLLLPCFPLSVQRQASKRKILCSVFTSSQLIHSSTHCKWTLPLLLHCNLPKVISSFLLGKIAFYFSIMAFWHLHLYLIISSFP